MSRLKLNEKWQQASRDERVAAVAALASLNRKLRANAVERMELRRQRDRLRSELYEPGASGESGSEPDG